MNLQELVNEGTKGVLSLFTYELIEILDSKLTDDRKVAEIRELLRHWIEPLSLEPEKVKTIPEDLSQRYLSGEVGIEAIIEFLEGK